MNLYEILTSIWQYLNLSINGVLSASVQLMAVFIVAVIFDFMAKFIFKFVNRRQVHKTAFYFIQSIILVSIRLVFVIIGFHVLGIQFSTIATFLGAVGISLSFALKDTANNLSAGLSLLLSGNLKIGDEITLKGALVIVKEIALLHTVGEESDGSDILIIPNIILCNNVVWKKRK